MHGVEHVYSMSRPGLAVITVQFEVGVKYNDAVLRLHDTVMSHRDWLAPESGCAWSRWSNRAASTMYPIVGTELLDRRSRPFRLRTATGGAGGRKRIEADQGHSRRVATLGGPEHVYPGG